MNEPDILYEPGFVAEPDRLLDWMLREIVWDERLRARKTASLGIPYNYSGLEYESRPMPEVLNPIVCALMARLAFVPNNCLANYYPDGSSRMGFHSDATDQLQPGTGIAIVSLGSQRTLTFRRTADKQVQTEVPLESGSLLHMSGEMQSAWQYGLLPDESAGSRISLTFRKVIPTRNS